MRNPLAILAVAATTVFGPSLAADVATDSQDSLEGKINDLAAMVRTLTTSIGQANGSEAACTATSPCGLWGRLDNLTAKVDAFANRGHQVAVVMAVPVRLTPAVGRGRHNVTHADYHLVGSSTIPGFPSTTVGTDGKFSTHNAHLPQGTYLFELQQPYSDQAICRGSVSRLKTVGGNGGRNAACPVVTLKVHGTNYGSTSHAQNKVDDGFLIATVTSNTANFMLHFRFPNDFTFTAADRPLNAYQSAVKLTKLK